MLQGNLADDLQRAGAPPGPHEGELGHSGGRPAELCLNRRAALGLQTLPGIKHQALTSRLTLHLLRFSPVELKKTLCLPSTPRVFSGPLESTDVGGT